MDSIKKFFDKKKTDVKFKKAGTGKTLSSNDGGSSSKQLPQHSYPQQRSDPSVSAQRAGQAALQRFSTNKSNTEVDWSMQAIKAQARREMEAEKQQEKLAVQHQQAAAAAGPTVVSVPQHVMFSCPLIGSDIGTYEEIKAAIREMLYAQLGEDKGVAAVIIIYTCNKSKEKINTCVETLCKYIENIVQHPSEEKYRRIRWSNRAYQDRVKDIEGARQFLEGAGFIEQELPFNDTIEKFWVFPESADIDKLEGLSDSLRCGEAVRPTLERSPAVLLPTQAMKQPQLPEEFFALSKEEIMKEMQAKTEAVEQSMMLRTKAMRERQNMREVRKYRFTLIRIRFPDGLTLQGTFRISETLSTVQDFIRGYLVNDWRPFFLCPSGGKKFSEGDLELQLAELFLVPAALLNFQWDAEVSDPTLDDSVYLSSEACQLIDRDTDE